MQLVVTESFLFSGLIGSVSSIEASEFQYQFVLIKDDVGVGDMTFFKKKVVYSTGLHSSKRLVPVD